MICEQTECNENGACELGKKHDWNECGQYELGKGWMKVLQAMNCENNE